MARGWESKSVEMQMEERETVSPSRRNTREDAELERRKQLLELSRKRLLQEIESASGERLREIKRRALRHVESELAAITSR
ncbi:MAG TPA: hypothetical protein VKB79_24325 [Bryobacteraceae bacterium]|nr:hypothetical protein [Bryobacteraceae bacterium]